MDDNGKQAPSFHLDQEILDARGIDMTVEEVAGLSTCKYAERVQQLQLTDDDLAFLKGLRRRIKNRLASQNSRRRSMEHLRVLARELRMLRARRDAATTRRLALAREREQLREDLRALRDHIAKTLEDRCDPTEIPDIEVAAAETPKITETPREKPKKSSYPVLTDCLTNKLDRDKNIFECRIDKIVQSSVNHIYKSEKDKKIFAKTVFLDEHIKDSQPSLEGSEKCKEQSSSDGVLNLSVKRRSHGRKQSAPRRIAYACMETDDGVLDLKIKKEPQ